MTRVEIILEHYLGCALWTNEELDNFSILDIEEESKEQAKKDIEAFLEKIKPLETEGEIECPEQIGHDFWLSRNGHGTGFFDRMEDVYQDQQDVLQEIAKTFPEVNIFLGNNGKVIIE
jgi:hypothetical protein